MWTGWQTVYSRWRLWIAKGVWSAAIKTLSRWREGVLRFLNASHLKVHQDAHGGSGGKEEQAIGLTRGGANTKLHALVDGKGRLLRATLTARQVGDARADLPDPPLCLFLAARSLCRIIFALKFRDCTNCAMDYHRKMNIDPLVLSICVCGVVVLTALLLSDRVLAKFGVGCFRFKLRSSNPRGGTNTKGKILVEDVSESTVSIVGGTKGPAANAPSSTNSNIDVSKISHSRLDIVGGDHNLKD